MLLGVIGLGVYAAQLAVVPEASALDRIWLASRPAPETPAKQSPVAERVAPAVEADSGEPVFEDIIEPVVEPEPVPAGEVPQVRRLRMVVTAYCPCSKCCGKWSRYRKTASGYPVTTNGGQFVAADTRVLPFGTRVRIPGYAGYQDVPVLDRGRLIKGYRLDVYFPSHAQAKQWGKQALWVEVIED